MAAHSDKPIVRRPLEPSEDVSRLACNLAQRFTMDVAAEAKGGATRGPRSEFNVRSVSSFIRCRRERLRYFPTDLFADPAWDIMLDLLEAELTERRVSVSSSCAAAGVPSSTALRWLKTLEQRGLITRHADPLDGRRFFFGLTPEVSLALRSWFTDHFSEPVR